MTGMSVSPTGRPPRGRPPSGSPAGGTDWRRFATVVLPAMATAAALATLVAQGALAASVGVSGQHSAVSFDELSGHGFQQYVAVDTDANGEHHPVAVTVIRTMTARRMCQSVKLPGPTGGAVLRVTAGGGHEPVTARDLVVDAEALRGDATFENIQIGQDAGMMGQLPVRPSRGMFGQQAGSVRLDHVSQRAWQATAGTFRLPNLRLRLGVGTAECS
jgi:hypothetical protein